MFLTKLANNAFAAWAGVVGTVRSGASDEDPESGFPDATMAPPDSRRLIRDRRYCRILEASCDLNFDQLSIECAWKALQHEMAFVPGGYVKLMQNVIEEHGQGYGLVQLPTDAIDVQPLYVDRTCTTNAAYARFVQAGGYEQPEFWPEEILPWVLQFVDTTGCPGPSGWADGRPKSGELHHPVRGICWYEANAFARWSGKRLPTSAEWQRCGTWPKKQAGDGIEQRFPWGHTFEIANANLWQSELGGPAPANAFLAGSTPNGVHQLIGNVWEWVDTSLPPIDQGDVRLDLEEMMAEVRGAAYDTYFTSQATCQFRSGQPILNRPSNVGFRCCIATDQLVPQPQHAVTQEADE